MRQRQQVKRRDGYHNTIKNSGLDKVSYDQQYDDSAKLKEEVQSQQETYTLAEELAEDLYNSLYKHHPTPVNGNPDTHLLNLEVVDSLFNHPKYDRLRTGTKSRRIESTMATSVMLKKLLDEVPEERKKEISEIEEENREIHNENQHTIQQMHDYQQELKEAPPEMNEKQKENLQQMIAKLQARAKKQQKQLDQVKEQMQEIVYGDPKKKKDNGCQIGAGLGQAIQAANDEVDQMEGMFAGWGFEDASNEQTSYEEKMLLLNKIKDNPQLKDIAKLLGRLKRIAMSKRRSKVKVSNREIVGIEQGDNLPRTLPSEMLNLALDELNPIFYKRFNNKELFQTKLGGKETVGQGPVIICLDESGSMGGLPNIWGKAIALATIQLAKKENRRFKVIAFSTSMREYEESHFDNFINGAISYASDFLNGGTNFQAPLDSARDFIRDNSEFKDADIFFITDGFCDVDEDWLKEFKKDQIELKFSVRSIAVGLDSMPEVLEKISVQTFCIKNIASEIADPKASASIFQGIVN